MAYVFGTLNPPSGVRTRMRLGAVLPTHFSVRMDGLTPLGYLSWWLNGGSSQTPALSPSATRLSADASGCAFGHRFHLHGEFVCKALPAFAEVGGDVLGGLIDSIGHLGREFQRH